MQAGSNERLTRRRLGGQERVFSAFVDRGVFIMHAPSLARSCAGVCLDHTADKAACPPDKAGLQVVFKVVEQEAARRRPNVEFHNIKIHEGWQTITTLKTGNSASRSISHSKSSPQLVLGAV